ncbi:MAG TPA: hypothetical protein PKE04_10625, partial [Clostridia bacterium]|nr:hypothetical protein [Clostridia bacterium]
MRMSRLFRRFLSGYLLIITVSLLCVVPVYYLSLHMAHQVEQARIGSTLQKGCDRFGEAIFSYNSALAILRNDSEFRTLIALSGTERPSDVLLAERVRAQLSNLIAPIGLHTEAVLSFERNGLVLDTHRVHISRSNHYGTFLSAQGMLLDDWLALTLYSADGSMAVRNVTLHLTEPKDYLILNFHIGLGGGRNANLALLVSITDLLELLAPESVLEQGAVILDTTDGERLAAYRYEGPTPEGGLTPATRTIRGEKTDVWTTSIPTRGLQITVLAPHRIYRASLSPVRVYIFLFALLALAVGVAAALLMAYRNTLPMRRLASRLSGVLHPKEGDKDIYQTIERTVSGLNMSLEHFSGKLDDMRHILRHNQLDAVLHGYDAGGESLLPPTGRILLLSIGRAPRPDTDVTLVSALNLMRSALPADALCHVIHPRHIAVVLPAPGLALDAAELRRILLPIRKQIVSLAGNEVRMAVSPVYESLESISDLYWALCNRMASSAFDASEICFLPQHQAAPTGLSLPQLHRLHNMVVSGAEQDVRAFFANEVFPLTESLDRVQGMRLFYSLAAIAHTTAQQADAPLQSTAYNERISMQPQLAALLEDIVQVACH